MLLGAAVTLCGIVWMLYNFNVISNIFFDRFFSWQTLLMALGGYFLLLRRWITGGALLATGLAFALTDWFGSGIPVGRVILPAILIAAGLSLMVKRR